MDQKFGAGRGRLVPGQHIIIQQSPGRTRGDRRADAASYTDQPLADKHLYRITDHRPADTVTRRKAGLILDLGARRVMAGDNAPPDFTRHLPGQRMRQPG